MVKRLGERCFLADDGLWSRLYGRPYLLLVLSPLFWAGNAVASRLAVGEVSPMALTTFRWSGVLLLLALFAMKPIMADWPVMKGRLPYMLAMGALGFTFFNAFFYIAAHFTSAVNIGIIQGALPGLVFVFAYLIAGTRAGSGQLAGMATTLVGVGVIAVKGDLSTLASLDFNAGDLMMLGACVVYALYTVLLPRRPKIAGLSFFAGLSVAAFLTSLPFLAAEIAMGQYVAPTPFGWAVVAYCAVFPSVVSQVFFVRGVELVGPGRAGVFINLIPVFGSLLAVLVLGESFRPYHALALALVLGGIFWAEWSKRGEVA
ncbi:EamA family transporter [Pleomorphomonas diazotrophica]|uniref:EamA family transporter n=1 Tax=Pleomorphomonas diazotrophica TaxID=1166257 RepID=A0A2N3LX97_9HYPH|nr:EamA family transporter [Pleomorphomonas diazotrophica]